VLPFDWMAFFYYLSQLSSMFCQQIKHERGGKGELKEKRHIRPPLEAWLPFCSRCRTVRAPSALVIVSSWTGLVAGTYRRTEYKPPRRRSSHMETNTPLKGDRRVNFTFHSYYSFLVQPPLRPSFHPLRLALPFFFWFCLFVIIYLFVIK